MKKEYEVLNIKCGGCASTVKKKLVERFPDIEVNLEKNPRVVRATVSSDEEEEYLLNNLRKLGYPLATDDMNMITEKYLFGKSYVSCMYGKHKL